MRRGSTVQKIYLSVQKSLAIYLLTGSFHLLNRKTTVESCFSNAHTFLMTNFQFFVLTKHSWIYIPSLTSSLKTTFIIWSNTPVCLKRTTFCITQSQLHSSSTAPIKEMAKRISKVLLNIFSWFGWTRNRKWRWSKTETISYNCVVVCGTPSKQYFQCKTIWRSKGWTTSDFVFKVSITFKDCWGKFKVFLRTFPDHSILKDFSRAWYVLEDFSNPVWATDTKYS